MRAETTGAAFAAALRYSHTPLARVEVWRAGARLDTGLPGGELPILGGEVKLDGTAKVGRQINIQVPNSDAIWRLLSVPGTELRPYAGLRFPPGITGGSSPADGFLGTGPLGSTPLGGVPAQAVTTVGGGDVWVPLGRLEVDQPHIDYTPDGAQLQVTGGDAYAKVQASDFILPGVAQFGTLITTQIIQFLQQALPGVPILNQVTASWVIGSKVYTNRAAAIEEMLAAISAELVFDAVGNAVLRPLPTVSGTAVWMVDADPESGVMLTADRQGDTTKIRNLIVVTSTAVDGAPGFDPVFVWDDDPTSPTYAGPDPVNNPGGAAAFGVRPSPLSSTAISDPAQARQAALGQLAQLTGLPSQLNITASPHPGLEPGDTIAVRLPPDPDSGIRPVEAHLIDSVTIPLTPEGVQQITTRTRGASS